MPEKPAHAFRNRSEYPSVLSLAAICAATLSCLAADNNDNLARAKGAIPFGNCSNGPFLVTKINDGRLDALGMWCSDGRAGAFGGVKLGDAPVKFNAVRFYLFNGRAAFTGWRLEGTNDCEIDEDSNMATFYDPELIATDVDGQFANSKVKENSVVSITFKAVSYKYVRLLFPNKSGLVGVPEIEVFNRDDNFTPDAVVNSGNDAALGSIKNTLVIPRPIAAAELIGKLKKTDGCSAAGYDGQGIKLNGADMLKNECLLSIKHTSGGVESPSKTEYTFLSIVDSSAPPAPPKPVKVVNRPPPPPKPLMTPVSAPDAPKDTVNLVEGKTITASIDPERAAGLAKSGDGNWFAQQRYPQWLCVDLGSETVFDYVSIRSLGHFSLQHFWIQVSNDGAAWKNLVEVDHVRRNTQWNGFFEKTKARYVRAVLVPPSTDVHVKKFVLANLAKPLTDKDGNPVPALKPTLGESPDLATLPKPAAD
ncbi:MAG TPA: discoidin domain-containing protein [Planctomycetota bacterium]|jgi:hypothetical protein